MSDHDLQERRLAEMLRGEGPASPSADLVDRIMQRIPTESAVLDTRWDRWNRAAWPVALAAGLAALVAGMGMLGARETAPVDPVGTITRQPETALEHLLGLSRP
jgi:hypothetical protein